ncbi:acyl-CoA thioesterase YciA [uncultured bacterium]|nr:acyl-CoA thioesterase YciA [uncultured bacterium]
MTPKPVSASVTIMTELVLPNHANTLGNLLGGQLMHWIDICAAMAAARHNQRTCVTASVDRIDFHHPIHVGDVVTLVASVNRVFRSSMEVGVKVFSEKVPIGIRNHTNTAYLTFVAVDSEGKPTPGAEILPETEEEKRRYDEALQRRSARLQNIRK